MSSPHIVVGRPWHLLLSALLCWTLIGCSSEEDPTKPDGAYHIFRDALFEGDAATVWERLDEETHQYFQAQYDYLVEMDEMISDYLPLTDHRIARRQSGVVLLEEVEDGRELFLRVFTPSELPQDEASRIGSNIDELQIAEDNQSAVVKTRAEQEYVLTREEDSKSWHIRLIKDAEPAMNWLDENKSALQQTVEDLISEERDKREAIIAELMNLKQD